MFTNSPEAAPGLLSPATVVAHLVARGIVTADQALDVAELGGGVSNTVLRVTGDGFDAVVKQALGRLKVEREWLADPGRTVAEGRALSMAASVAPDRVPQVLDLDEAAYVLVIEAAPAEDWKQQLLRGEVDASPARAMGEFLGRLHRATTDDPAVANGFDLWEAFEQLRVRPYFRTLVEDDPSLGSLVLPRIEEMQRRRSCLVHGDVSPKNVLVGPDVCWLVDFEVAHHGDPAFDVAFMLNHLALKAMHLPASAGGLTAAAAAFVSAYVEADGPCPLDAHLAGLLGCLMMARVRGRSPAEYLDEAARRRAWQTGTALAAAPPDRLFGIEPLLG